MISTKKLAARAIGETETGIAPGDCGAGRCFKPGTGELKELMTILAHIVDLTGERDRRHSRQFQEFTGCMQAIAGLQDLALIRESLERSVIDLRVCAEAMAEENRQSVAHLRADVKAYQMRLDDAEQVVGHDPLTGLYNRLGVESSVEERMERKKTFSVLLLDLNGFKWLNDTCGRLAADDILKQFGAELKSGFRATDVVGRLGSDEFIIVLDTSLTNAQAHIQRISRWAFGDYVMRVGDISRKVAVNAAIGAAEWQAGDSAQTLLDRAEAAMYLDKHSAVARSGAAPGDQRVTGAAYPVISTYPQPRRAPPISTAPSQ